MEADYPLLYAQLLKDRNNRWMPKIITMLGTETEEMVLVGAAHLAGDHGLLNQLAEAGYNIEQL